MTEKPLTASDLADIVEKARPQWRADQPAETLADALAKALRAHAKAQEPWSSVHCPRCGGICYGLAQPRTKLCDCKPAPQPEPELPTWEDWGELAKRLEHTDPISGVTLSRAARRLASGELMIVRPGEMIPYDPKMKAERDTLKVENARLREAVVEARGFIEPALKTFGGFGTWNVYGIARDFLARTREWA